MAEDEHYDLAKHPIVKRTGQFTDRVWRNAQSQLIEFMEQAKSERIRAERIDVLDMRFNLLQDMWAESFKEHRLDGFPPVRTFALIPEVREIMEAPNEVKVTAETYEVLLPCLPDILDRWRKTARSQLEQRVKEILPASEAASASSLAITTFYHCRRCLGVSTRQNVLLHSCSSPYAGAADSMDPLEVVFRGFNVFDAASFFMEVDLIKPVIIACGQDPLTATADAMDRLDPKLTCLLKCCKYRGIRSVMSWRTAVLHSLQYTTLRGPECQWAKADEYDKELLDPLERAAAWGEKLKVGYGWRCGHCSRSQGRFGGTHSEVSEHIRTSHNIAQPSDSDLIESQWSYLRLPYLISNDLDGQPLPGHIARAVLDGTAAYETRRAEEE